MKRILILIIGLIGVAQAQYSPTSAKSRFVNGLALGTKLDSYFNAADSNAIYWRADSVLMAKYKGTARALAFAVSGGYLPISDTATMLSNYRRTSTRIENSDLRFSTISGVSLGASLFGLSTGYGLNGSGYDGGAIRTWEVDTNAISTKANVTGALVGYTTVSRFTDSLTNVQSRIQTKQPLGAYITFADSATILAGRWLPNRSADSIAVIRALANSKGTGSVTSVATGVGLSGGTITTSGTISADTTTLSTRAYVTGQLVGYATTGNLALKLNISDTAAMLSGYKTYYPRTAISAGTGISYNAATGVITNSSPSSGGTVTSVATNTGSGITGGTITSTGTIAADTTILSTKANVTGTLVGYTTLAQNALKVNISDTATMLSNYRRKTTLIENADLRNSAITINGSSTSLGSSISVGTVTSVSAGTGMSFTTITSTGAVNADTTTLATRAYAAGLDVAKANTSLNNVNGVLSSTYGGAGIINGILKANGSGVVSAAVAGDITTLISGTYLPLSGGTLTGGLSGTSLSMSGEGLFGGAITNGVDKLRVTGSVRATGAGRFGGSGSNAQLEVQASSGEVFRADAASGAFRIVADQTGVNLGGGLVNLPYSSVINWNSTANQYITADASNLYLGTAGASRLTISTSGAITASSSVTASSLIKSGGTSTQSLMADGSVQTLTSGTYTPTITNTSNITSTTARTTTYTRVGNTVTVSGWVTITTTSNEVATEIGVSLPIASAFTAAYDLSGSGLYEISTTSYTQFTVKPDTTNDRAKIVFYPFGGSGTAVETQFSFQYQVL